MLILDKLITLTIEEVEMYPSVQAKIWGNIGKSPLPFPSRTFTELLFVFNRALGHLI